MWLKCIDRDLKKNPALLQDRSLWIPVPWKPRYEMRFLPSYVAPTEMVQGEEFDESIVLTESTFTRSRLGTSIGRARRCVWLVSTCLASHYEFKSTVQACVDATQNEDPPKVTVMQEVIRDIWEEKNRKAGLSSCS